MKQADLGLNLTTKPARKREFLDEMSRVVPWSALVELVSERQLAALICAIGTSQASQTTLDRTPLHGLAEVLKR